MSVPKLISPLLDGFIMGEPISDHHGVRSCPAIREDTDERYIVKIVSIPATQTQLDALLLSGAFKDEREAQGYFKELAEGVSKEAATLSRLSRLEGFLPYQSGQTIRMDDGVGYDVYLLAPYRRSLEKQLRSEPPTHLAAVNLGLDMCAALAVCRRAGFLYVDLKPENIFLTDMRGYCIGDLGFIPMASLKYASLPEKYHSPYTAPEITDAYASLNDTLDIYALGLVLYQIYNNGELPFDGSAPVQTLPPPMYADYEMADIILKACAPDPGDRWADPAQMGQALVDYMQRNSVNDTPIVPPPVEPVESVEEEAEDFLSEEENDEELAEILAMIPDEEPPADVCVPEEAAPEEDTPEEAPAEDTAAEQETVEVSTEDPPAEEAIPGSDICEGSPAEEEMLSLEDIVCATSAEDTDPEDAQETPTDAAAEQAEGSDRTELTEDGVTTEVAEMLAQADELLLMELPEPVVAPAPIDVPIPPPIIPEPEPEPEPEAEPEADPEEASAPTEEAEDRDLEAPETDVPTEDPDDTEDQLSDSEAAIQSLKKRRLHGWIAFGVILALIAALAFGAYYFYQNEYLQTIDSLVVDGTEDEICVQVVSQIDESLLTVVCTDTYGNTLRSPVTDGKATFSSLNPSTRYQIHVHILGQHKLLGATTGSYTTAAQTELLNLSAMTGPDDGSVILSFTVNGPDSDGWKVEYSAPGIDSKTTSFTGKHVTLSGLTVGAEYTFRLLPDTELYVTGTDHIRFTPQKIVYAQDLTIRSCGNGSMTVAWAAPEGCDGKSWTVRCYNDAGYDQSFTTTETTATFEDLDHSTSYTVIVTAEGMTQSQSITATADPINVTGFVVERKEAWAMDLTWTSTGQTPSNGWILTYTIDDSAPITVMCPENSATIALQPGGTYTFDVRPVDDITYFGLTHTYGPVETDTYSGFTVTAADMSLTMYTAPAAEYWDANDLIAAAPKSEYAVGESACLLIQLAKSYEVTDDIVVTTFVIRDANNGLVSTESSSRTWDEMWHKRMCAVQIPQMPTTPGTYTLDIYMDGGYVSTLEFTIV